MIIFACLNCGSEIDSDKWYSLNNAECCICKKLVETYMLSTDDQRSLEVLYR